MLSPLGSVICFIHVVLRDSAFFFLFLPSEFRCNRSQWFRCFWQEPEDIPPQEERSVRQQGKNLDLLVSKLARVLATTTCTFAIVWRAASHARRVSWIVGVAITALGHRSEFDVPG